MVSMSGVTLSRPLRASGGGPSAGEQRNQEEHEEHDKQNLGDPGGGSGDTAETKHSGEEGDNQEYNGVVKHGV
ncbi:hypothetical protein AYO49_03115 [Verrucomicrobiaceae bacterium SCGC AG-212-N21]|nr:hypothetical protein AYO49_03115 [Verrucomicrobiaceae bacterium SCGC AG-212-N21]